MAFYAKVALIALLAVAVTADQRPNYGQNGGRQPHAEKEPGMPYDFSYNVKDEYSGNDFGHSENSDGEVVRGEYYVQLPDGRLQRVTYTADHDQGFVADVQYEGEARYDEPQQQQQNGGRYN